MRRLGPCREPGPGCQLGRQPGWMRPWGQLGRSRPWERPARMEPWGQLGSQLGPLGRLGIRGAL